MQDRSCPAGQGAPFSIRRAALTDAAALAALCTESMGYPASEPEVRERLRPLLQDTAHCILVAEAGGEAVGYIHACDYLLLYAPPMKNILGLAVSPAFRRLGAARCGGGLGAADGGAGRAPRFRREPRRRACLLPLAGLQLRKTAAEF